MQNDMLIKEDKMYQVSTLQALALGYSRAVVKVSELRAHGDIGLGTFEDVNGEMIVLEGEVYRADETGHVTKAPDSFGVPFAAVAGHAPERERTFTGIDSAQTLRRMLDLFIEEDFGLNSMHAVRVDGFFQKVYARSESAYRSAHVTLKEVLSGTQKDFLFEQVRGTLVCIYFPDYMDGINAPGWHFHFISDDRTQGGHVFELCADEAVCRVRKIQRLEIQFPREPAFDTYALKNASQEEIRHVEQGKS